MPQPRAVPVHRGRRRQGRRDDVPVRSRQRRWRQLGKPKYEDVKVQVGMAMSAPFYEWIAEFFAGRAARKNGAILAADFDYVERARREFAEAMIKEITFPALSASDKNAASMTIALAVERMVFARGSGQTLAAPAGFDAQKRWAACHFRFTIDGFDDACRRVTKVDSFTIKQTVIEHHVGGQREPIKVPSRIDFPNLVFSIPEADADPFFEHVAQRVGRGEKSGGLTGQLEVQDVTGKTLATVSFLGADIISVTPTKSDSSSEELKQVRIELMTEGMAFAYA
ncbi:MAG: phage tail protein [Kofleriaceae bacterium]